MPEIYRFDRRQSGEDYRWGFGMSEESLMEVMRYAGANVAYAREGDRARISHLGELHLELL
jgi:hypothetical protein